MKLETFVVLLLQPCLDYLYLLFRLDAKVSYFSPKKSSGGFGFWGTLFLGLFVLVSLNNL